MARLPKWFQKPSPEPTIEGLGPYGQTVLRSAMKEAEKYVAARFVEMTNGTAGVTDQDFMKMSDYVNQIIDNKIRLEFPDYRAEQVQVRGLERWWDKFKRRAVRRSMRMQCQSDLKARREKRDAKLTQGGLNL